MNRHQFQFSIEYSFVALLLIAMIAGCRGDKDTISDNAMIRSENKDETIPASWSEGEKSVYRTNAAENLIEKLVSQLGSLKNRLDGSSEDLGTLFVEGFDYIGPEENSFEGLFQSALADRQHQSIRTVSWPVSKSRIISRDIWKPVLRGKLSKIKLGVLSGNFPDDRLYDFEMKLILEAHYDHEKFQDKALGIEAKQNLIWKKSDAGWQIHSWEQESLHVKYAPSTLFLDRTEDWIADAEVMACVSKSPMHEMLLMEASGKAYPQLNDERFLFFNDWRSSAQFPCVSLVDYDNDGWEDIFLTGGHIRSLMLKNIEGKQFEDKTRESGLLIDPAYSNCTLFADFDNDGDADVLIGRTFDSTSYFDNSDGKFSRNAKVSDRLQHAKFVTSGSVVDINRDGLLDVYLSTYCVHGRLDREWVKLAVAPEHEEEYWRRLNGKYHPVLNRPGPPNILLANRNGRLEPVKINVDLQQWRSSYQTAWIDYDGDGDSDLYICNDFAPDAFLRNDTERGSFDFKFVDVTEEVFSSKLMGFGMGVSVGDFDSDADLDLYVSNMYSKAGHRVFEQVGGIVSPATEVAAKGNFLYRNLSNGKFQQVAGFDEGQKVAKVGWSFGGQFADFDNDTKLDLYVPSGLFTSPKQIASERDL